MIELLALLASLIAGTADERGRRMALNEARNRIALPPADEPDLRTAILEGAARAWDPANAFFILMRVLVDGGTAASLGYLQLIKANEIAWGEGDPPGIASMSRFASDWARIVGRPLPHEMKFHGPFMQAERVSVSDWIDLVPAGVRDAGIARLLPILISAVLQVDTVFRQVAEQGADGPWEGVNERLRLGLRPHGLANVYDMGPRVLHENIVTHIVVESGDIEDWLEVAQPNTRTMTWRQAVDGAHAWHAGLAEESRSALSRPSRRGTPVATWGDGGRMVRLTNRKDLEEEGHIMGNCVGGYTDRVLRGSSMIFSYRDGQGVAHATIEAYRHPTAGGTPCLYVSQVKGPQNQIPIADETARLHVRWWLFASGASTPTLGEPSDKIPRLLVEWNQTLPDLVEGDPWRRLDPKMQVKKVCDLLNLDAQALAHDHAPSWFMARRDGRVAPLLAFNVMSFPTGWMLMRQIREGAASAWRPARLVAGYEEENVVVKKSEGGLLSLLRKAQVLVPPSTFEENEQKSVQRLERALQKIQDGGQLLFDSKVVFLDSPEAFLAAIQVKRP